MSLWEAVLLGVIQGLTEFLPISSTAHLLVARQLLGHENPRDAFTTAIQLGTLVAVFVYFRADLVRMAAAVAHGPCEPPAGHRDRRPAVLDDGRGDRPSCACAGSRSRTSSRERCTTRRSSPRPPSFSRCCWSRPNWLRGGVRHAATRAVVKTRATWADAILVGLFQTLALIPGASRSGVTITAGLFAGLSRPAAARFSFLLSLPSILGAGLYDTYKDRNEIFHTSSDVVNLLVGAAVAGSGRLSGRSVG